MTSPMARLQKEMQAAVTTGAADQPAFPARWLYGCFVISLGTGLIAPIIGVMRKHHCRLGLSTGRPGPHDLTVRRLSFVHVIRSRCDIATPTASPPRVS